MKTLKKILALALVLAMFMSVVAYAGYNDVDMDEDYAGAVELLSALEIFVGDEYGNFNPNKTITRAEMAAIMCRAKGLESAAKSSKGSTKFDDVPADHWASGYINIANQNGIIAGYGDGNFGPEDTVTYNQAVKMVVCALGFEPMASGKGGWPTGYLVVGNTYGITDGVSGSTRADVAILIYNALSSPMMDQTSWGSDTEFEVLDGKKGKEYRTLLTDMDIYVASGIVGSKTYDEVEFEITYDSDDYEFEEGDFECFEINGTDIANYQHQNVEAYVQKVRKGDYKVIAVVSSVEGTSLTIISDDVYGYANNKVEYYIDPANSSKTKTIKLNKDPQVEYNKRDYSGSLYSLLMSEEDVELKFIENTGDNAYDVVVATKYYSARVGEVNPGKGRIEIGGTTVTLDLDDEDITIILEDEKGRSLDLEDFEEDDVVAVVADNANFKNYIDYIRITKLNDAVVRGYVESTFTSGGYDYVVIDGEEFIDGTGTSLSVGDEGLFFIGMTGKVIDFDGSSASADYAYILEAAIANETFSTGKWKVKLLTMDDGIVTYSLTESANDYFENTYASKLGISSNQSKQLYEDLSVAEKANPDRIITYKTNARGYIKSFKSAQESASKVKYLDADHDEYNGSTQNIAGAYLEDNAVIFNLTSTSVDKAYSTDVSYLVDDAKYSGLVLANEDFEYCVMVITNGASTFEAESGFAIATKVASIDDDDGNSVTKVTFVQNEDTGRIVYFTDDSENYAGSDSAYENIRPGDVFAYNASYSGYVSEYVILGKINSSGLFDVNKSAFGAFDDETEFIYGYISSTASERKKTSKGEVININSGKEDAILVTNSSNKYTYNDAGRTVIIEVGDYLAEDAYHFDSDTNEATFVFVKLVDENVVDIYSFNERVQLGGYISVELLIDAIGTVEYTSASLAKIEAAEEAYSGLSTSQKSKVSNYSVLTAARTTYNSLKDAAEAAEKEAADRLAAETVETLINQIGTVELTETCRTKIEIALKAYEDLTKDQQAYVENYDVLVTAVNDFNTLNDEANSAAAVENVVELINAIGTVDGSDACKVKIDAARAAYDALTLAEQGKVSNYSTLTAAEAEYGSLSSTAAVAEVELLINNIGKVEPTDECKENIEIAEDAYNALSDSEKAQVANADALKNAKSAYNASVAKVADVKALINAIGTVSYTEDCAGKIEAAREAYSKLETAEKYAVTNYAVLAEAENKYSELESAAKADEKVANDKAEAAKVDALINAIGTVEATSACKEKIEAAEDAYEALTSTQKSYVANYATLTAAKAAYTKAVEEAKVAGDKAEAAKVDALINAIGTVTATDACKAKIEAAEDAYEALTSTQKSYVANYATLTAAKAAYTKAVEEAKVADDKAEAAKVDALINAIGTADATDACKAKIEDADAAYSKLTNAQKSYVANHATLVAAKALYNKAVEEAKAAEDKAEAAKVDALINAIGTADATDACKARIDAADKAYNELTSTQKNYVANYATLTAAKKAYTKAVEEAKAAEDKAAAAKVDALIAQIGTVDTTDACKARIDAADKAYNELTSTQKNYVANYTTLTAAKVAYSKAVELKNIADKKIDQTKVEPGKIVGNKLQSIKISPATK